MGFLNFLKSKPSGLIRYVLLVVSHPNEPTPRQTFEFMESILPELGRQEKKHEGVAKIAWLWKTEPMSSIDMTALAAKSFGAAVVDNGLYTYRTIHFKLQGGEAKCLVAYDKGQE
jgi:hypothetical protein